MSPAQTFVLNLMLQLRLITRGCAAWRVAYIYPVTVYTVSSVSVRNSSSAKVNSECLMVPIRTEFENNNYLKGKAEEMTCKGIRVVLHMTHEKGWQRDTQQI
jgi:hypothetical protein